MDARAVVKRMMPSRWLNGLLLALPVLYRLPFVRFETSLTAGGIRDLHDILERAAALPGDVIECGSSRCGSTVLIADDLRRRGVRKTIFACDSFEGFDRAEILAEKAAGLANAPDDAFTSTSLEYVTRKIDRLGHAGTIRPVKGYFESTLPAMGGPFALAFIDCDLRKSATFCAETLWPRLVPGGALVFDDYAEEDFRGARLAVDEFVAAHAGEIAEHGLGRRLYRVIRKPAP